VSLLLAGDCTTKSVENAPDTINFAFHPALGAGKVKVYPVPEILNTFPESDKFNEALADTNS
jgi:hypothetical protein